MPIAVRAVEYFVTEVRTRMPFRYGIAELRACPHLFVRAEADVDGRRVYGLAADHLPPKWFTKDPDTAYADDLRDMIAVIRAAGAHAVSVGRVATAFAWWQRVYERQERWAAGTSFPPLLWNFGVSLAERAVIDAVCRAAGVPFHAAIRNRILGFEPWSIHDELREHGAGTWGLLPSTPSGRIVVRHTVGLSDALTDADVAPGERVDDGLPQSLEASIRAYGITHFKIKLCGEPARDCERLARIAAVLDRAARDYAVTLDGNENFRDLDGFRTFWHALNRDASAGPFVSRLLFVEQPLHRDVALGDDVTKDLRRWDDRPVMIIDESDARLGTARGALDAGYAGTSHKNCKGVFKGAANALLIANRRRSDPAGRFVLSGEDLTNVGPVALPQDLAVMAALGVPHVERNGHHYFTGLSMFPADAGEAVLRAHGDLYRRHERGFATLRIEDGTVAVGSANAAPFGVGAEVDVTRFESLDVWEPRVLGPGGRGI